MSTIKRYHLRPEPIEAIQLTPETMKECLEWIGADNISAAAWAPDLYIRLAEGRGTAFEGYWIIRYPDGTFLSFWREVFEAQYEEETP